MTYLYYLVIVIIDFFICRYVVSQILITGLLGFVLKGFVIMIITYILFILLVWKMKEFKELKEALKNIILAKFFRRKEV